MKNFDLALHQHDQEEVKVCIYKHPAMNTFSAKFKKIKKSLKRMKKRDSITVGYAKD